MFKPGLTDVYFVVAGNKVHKPVTAVFARRRGPLFSRAGVRDVYFRAGDTRTGAISDGSYNRPVKRLSSRRNGQANQANSQTKRNPPCELATWHTVYPCYEDPIRLRNK